MDKINWELTIQHNYHIILFYSTGREKIERNINYYGGVVPYLLENSVHICSNRGEKSH